MKDSSIIKSIDWKDGLLSVGLKNNDKVYEYKDVPEDVFESFKNADSLGSFFATKIKGIYEEPAGYPFPSTKPSEGYNINKPRPWQWKKDSK